MQKRELVFADETSNKFWTITLDGTKHTVYYGRAGTKGQEKTKEFQTAEQARADFETMVASKLKKGYTDATTANTGAGPDSSIDGSVTPLNPISPTNFLSQPVTTNAIYEHISTFAGKPVREFDPSDPPKIDGSSAYRVASDWDNEDRCQRALELLGSEPRPQLTHLVIGSWSTEMFETPAQQTISKLVEQAERLPNLQALFLGDITMEESEMSWIQQSDVAPLLSAFPNLEVLRVRGGDGLAIQSNGHANLRCLALETGGMDASIVRSISTGDFPNLEHLELWLGTENYGGTCAVEDLQPLLSGRLFSKLNYLGLRNCDFVDDIAGVVINSPITNRITTLDLSLGTLSDTGGEALLNLPINGILTSVDLQRHYLSEGIMAQLEGMPLEINLADRETDDEWRHVAVGE